jgi:hypothetical protein
MLNGDFTAIASTLQRFRERFNEFERRFAFVRFEIRDVDVRHAKHVGTLGLRQLCVLTSCLQQRPKSRPHDRQLQVSGN